MICSSSSPPIRRRPGEGRGPRGFTLVELLTVILILAVLIALLLPALNGAVRTARNAAVGGEIDQLAQALASFKAKYGDYPPSRLYLAEDGDYGIVTQAVGSTKLATGDMTYAQLAQRSLAYMRKFFPKVVLNTNGIAVFPANSPRWYDFNGNGVFDGHYIIEGHQCLVFFLGGIPELTTTIVAGSTGVVTGMGMSGFAKDPTNPFVNATVTTNRQAPFFEFVANRLEVLANYTPYSAMPAAPNFPGYVDSLGNTLGSGQINFYAYFSAYGNGGYDPNDVNFAETDDFQHGPIGLAFNVTFPVAGNICQSAAPNPYTSSLTAQFNGTVPVPTIYLNPQTFQIISSGADGLYGVGGQYSPNAATETLPLDPNTNNYLNTTDSSIRVREKDNITNFHNGKLE
jgi:prepilin-type N-terminal cleavage/methylation domain-containing protein